MRQREAVLAARVAARGPSPASRPLAMLAEVGDQRVFNFDQFGGVAAQGVPATVVALSQHAVAWAHDGSGAGGAQLPAPRIRQMLEQFDADFDLLVRSLGGPCDVDGDGRVHFLYTPLVDSTGFGGFVDAASILSPDVGGNGNHTDLIFLALGEPINSYRSLLAHEFQHLINFNQHVLVRFGDDEVSWLNEGLSHLVEDLVEGHTTGGNADRVATYLANPSLVGLIGDASTSAAKRGGAYLFVRSLVDRFGESILLRLIGSGLADVDNLERATGESFEDLLAGFAAQLATSGTGLSPHPRFDYTFAALAPEGRRGFSAPEMTRINATGGIRGQLAGRGLSFFRVRADQTQDLALATSPDAGLAALVLPLPAGFEFPVWVARDHFSRVTLDQSLPAVVRSGEAVRVAGRIDAHLFPPGTRQRGISLEYQTGEGTAAAPSYTLAVEGDRFEGDLVFAHAQSGEYELAVFARYVQDDEFQYEWLGSFQPAQVLPGEGIVFLPTRYFDRLQLDSPWPTRMGPDEEITWSGIVLDREGAPDYVQIQADLAGTTDTLSVRMDVVEGHFSGQLRLSEHPLGTYTLNLLGQDPDGQFTWLGGTDHFEVGHTPITAILGDEGTTPATARLGHNYPNPFNSQTVIPFQLDQSRWVEMTVHNLSGQVVAQWQPGMLPAGTHQWRWQARTRKGGDLASGVYIVQLRAGDLHRTRKLLLLR